MSTQGLLWISVRTGNSRGTGPNPRGPAAFSAPEVRVGEAPKRRTSTDAQRPRFTVSMEGWGPTARVRPARDSVALPFTPRDGGGWGFVS